MAALILFYEKPEQTIECVKSLLPHNLDIVLLNNGSSNYAVTLVNEAFQACPSVRIIDSKINLGVAGGRNKLIESTTHEWLLFLDNDITCLTADMLPRFWKHVQENPDVHSVTGKLYNLHYQAWQDFSFHEDGVGGQKRKLLDRFPGGVTFVNRRLFDDIGVYNDSMFVGLEDFELAARAERQRFTIRALLVDDIEFCHDHRHISCATDRDAIETRYSVEHISNSAKVLEKQGSPFASGWESWVEEQKRFILSAPSISCVSKPTSCTLYMTAKCNFECSWCLRNTVGFQGALDVTVPVVTKILELFPNIQGFCLAGQGEPTLADDFDKVVNTLHERGKVVNLITNGTNPEPILQARGKISSINVSLYGANEEEYVSYCKRPFFSTMVESFLALKDAFPNVGFSYILDKMNIDRLERVLKLCDLLKPSFIHLLNPLWYDLCESEGKHRMILSRETDIQKRIVDLAAGRAYTVNLPTYPDFSSRGRRCASYSNVINVDGNGNIGGCRRQITPDSLFGNIFTCDDPYNTDEMMRLRRNQQLSMPAHPECTYCFGNWIEG